MVKRTKVGVDLAFECAGGGPTLQDALESVRTSGRVIVLSLAWEPVRCLPVDWVGRQVEMKAAYETLPDDWPIALWLLETRKIQVTPIISHIIPLKDMQKVFQELLKPDTSLGQVVVAFE